MVLKIPSVKTAIIILMLVFMTLSCEKQMLVIVKCKDCTAEEPVSAFIYIRLSKDPLIFDRISINVYEGDNTSGLLIDSFEINYGVDRSISVGLNRTYTIEAIYRAGPRTYRVYDSARPLVKYSKSDCEEACYFVYNYNADLRLKYL